MRRINILFILFYFVLTSHAQSIVCNTQTPKHEVRAVWLTTIGGIDWPHSYAQSSRSIDKQKMELIRILDRLQEAHINTVLLQTRIRGTMIYPSQYEPWDGCLSGFPGKSPGYDALQFAIDECHKRGMELHAWVVTIPIGKWNGLGCQSLRKRFPKMVCKIEGDGYMNPEMPQTATYLANICREITHRYDVDGIHLDYIRYPETWKKIGNLDKARQNITRIVEKIHEAVKGEKPWVKLSCSPIGKFDDLSRYWSHGWNAYTKVAQDAQGWLRNGLMDELFPMMYFRGDQFYPFAIDWQENSDGKIIAPGLGIYFLDPKEGKWNIQDVTAEMFHLRNIGQGHAFFRCKFLLDNHQGIYDFVTNTFNLYPALVPPMSWLSHKKPLPPTGLVVSSKEEATILSWTNTNRYEDNTQPRYIYNNVYASHEYPVDTQDAKNLICPRKIGNKLQLGPLDDSSLYFAITSMDEYGNESEPCQMDAQHIKNTSMGRQGKAKLLKIHDEYVELPISITQTDVKYILVRSLQNQPIYITRPKNMKISIKNIKDGVYTLNCVTHKNIEHTIGTIFKKSY